MKKNLLLYILSGFLVLVNGFFLFNHFSKTSKSGHREPSPANFISEQLEFDAKQTQQFKDLEAEHREKMRFLFEDIKELKDTLFEKISKDNVNAADIDAIAALIGEKEKAKELETFHFFKAVGKLCNANQKEKFESIIKDALRRNGPPPGGDSPPRGRPKDEGRPPPPRH